MDLGPGVYRNLKWYLDGVWLFFVIGGTGRGGYHTIIEYNVMYMYVTRLELPAANPATVTASFACYCYIVRRLGGLLEKAELATVPHSLSSYKEGYMMKAMNPRHEQVDVYHLTEIF